MKEEARVWVIVVVILAIIAVLVLFGYNRVELSPDLPEERIDALVADGTISPSQGEKLRSGENAEAGFWAPRNYPGPEDNPSIDDLPGDICCSLAIKILEEGIGEDDLREDCEALCLNIGNGICEDEEIDFHCQDNLDFALLRCADAGIVCPVIP